MTEFNINNLNKDNSNIESTNKNSFFDEFDNNMFSKGIFSINDSSDNLVMMRRSKFNLVDQLKINKTGLKIFLYQALIFINYNINVNHLCFRTFVQNLGIIPSLVLLFSIGFFSFIFQIKLIEKLENNQNKNISLLLEKHFGTFCSLLFKILCFGWILYNYLITFLTYLHFLIYLYYSEDEVKLKDNWKFCICSIGIFIIVFVIINTLENSNWIDFNIFLNLICNVISTIFIIKKLYDGISKNEGLENKLYVKNIKKNDIIYSICLFSTSFNNLLVLSLVNKNLNLSLYPLLEHKKFLLINHFIIFLFYSLFIFQSAFDIFDTDKKEDQELSLLILIIDSGKIKEIFNLIFVISNLLSEFLNLNFYLYSMKKAILKSNEKFKFTGFKHFIFTFFILIIVSLIGLKCYFNKVFPKSLILINNSTFGFIINFLIPSLFILKYSLSFSSYFLLSFIFLMFSICLSHIYELIDSNFLK